MPRSRMRREAASRMRSRFLAACSFETRMFGGPESRVLTNIMAIVIYINNYDRNQIGSGPAPPSGESHEQHQNKDSARYRRLIRHRPSHGAAARESRLQGLRHQQTGSPGKQAIVRDAVP